MFRILVMIAVIGSHQIVAANTQGFTAADIEFFESKVRPLLIEHCYECHSTDAKAIKGGLYVDSREAILRGGESGPAAVAGVPSESILIDAVRYEGFEMPPDNKLAVAEIDILASWIEKGLPWPPVTSTQEEIITESEIDWEAARQSHWAWRAFHRAEVSLYQGEGDHPIDMFVAAQRDKNGMQVASPADAYILIRRIFFDLVGVPPTPQQVVDFEVAVSSDRDSAIESLVDQLLASPLYGQRWGRHWLDVARYSDGFGGFLDNSELKDAWRYRDWIVNALNNDMPFNRFIELQIAGDLLGDKNDAIATGFFAVGPLYRSDGGDPDSVAQAVGETLDDRVDTLTRGLLGVTASCARCHDHKFDPIPQIDYYSVAGIFHNTGIHHLPLSSDSDIEKARQHSAAVAELSKKIKRLKAVEQQAEKAVLQEQLKALKASSPPKMDTAHTLHDTNASDMHVAIRGNLRKEGQVAPRRMLRIVSGPEQVVFSDGSGRKELAASIISPKNGLTARVFVNRVWQHHFGNGIVRTTDNFGALGEPPTHPELLDWLASEFVAGGWSIKNLHRVIMKSKTYQLSSRSIEGSFMKDSDNRLLWRMSPRRMDVEAWRDSLLSVTGELDTAANGAPVDDIMNSNRRTLYARVSRNGDAFPSDDFLRRFDFPSMRATTGKRPQSVVPQQFLFLLNSPFMLDRAKAFVSRLENMGGNDEKRIQLAYLLLFSRPATDEETTIGMDFLNSAAKDTAISRWVQYSQMLLSSNEFMFVR